MAEIGTIANIDDIRKKVNSMIKSGGDTTDKQRQKIHNRIKRQSDRIEKLMHSAPFWRTADKVGFMVGVTIMLTFIYFIAKFPHDFFYKYYTVLMPTLIFLRMGHYYSLGWHYYISDFCYYANCLVLYLISQNS